ncbi:MAG: hypothetical protein GY772_06755 [bacterium]|nr:hypothetical protein [bacterium]
MPHNPHDPFNERLRQAYEQGKMAGHQAKGHSVDLGIQQSIQALRQEMAQQINRSAGGIRKMVDHKMATADQKLSDLATIAKSLQASRSEPYMGGAPGTIRIEDIPGRRVPFTLLVDIAIGANTTSVREASVTISQEGPFVAVKRMATFQSAYEFQVTDPQTQNIGRFAGRSFGRYRPVSSAWDLLDSQHNARADTATWWWDSVANSPVGAGAPEAALGLASNISSFRTMEFDGRFRVVNAGSSYPRQNISVPSSFWSTSINAPWDLGSLDFFERGEVLTVEVQPTHTNNPPAGNIDGSCVFTGIAANPGFPFLDGQYDAHEGINTPGAASVAGANPSSLRLLSQDSVARLPDGILTIGWEGYRIIQPVGPAI